MKALWEKFAHLNKGVEAKLKVKIGGGQDPGEGDYAGGGYIGKLVD